MLATIGDVVDDIVVHRAGPIRVGTDTPAQIRRRRGGSAANVAVAAAYITGRARFLGQVGDDAMGELLLGELEAERVETQFVRRRGRSGSIVVLVDQSGERSFLTDRGSTRDVDHPEPAWLDDADVLHIPLYSLVEGAIATTSRTLAAWAHEREIPISVDLSSVSVIEALGHEVVMSMIAKLAPTAVFANDAEATALDLHGPAADAITFVKRGAAPASVFVPADVPGRDSRTSVSSVAEKAGQNGRSPVEAGYERHEVAAETVESVVDTTGAGDAFAAGVLTRTNWRDDPVAAAGAGHAAAAALLRSRTR